MPETESASIRPRACADERDGDDGSVPLLLRAGDGAVPRSKEGRRPRSSSQLLFELPSVLSYLPTSITYKFVLCTPSIQYRVSVIDVDEDLLPRGYAGQ